MYSRTTPTSNTVVSKVPRKPRSHACVNSGYQALFSIFFQVLGNEANFFLLKTVEGKCYGAPFPCVPTTDRCLATLK